MIKRIAPHTTLRTMNDEPSDDSEPTNSNTHTNTLWMNVMYSVRQSTFRIQLKNDFFRLEMIVFKASIDISVN